MRVWEAMIDEATRPRSPHSDDPWRRWWLTVFVLVLVVITGFVAGRKIVDTRPVSSPSPMASTAPSSAEAEAAGTTPSSEPPVLEDTPTPEEPSSEPSPSATADTGTDAGTDGDGTGKGSDIDPDALRLSGKVPSHGSGKFDYATTTGAVHGTKGPLRRFRVAVERGSGEDVDAFAETVESTLGDARSWTGGGTLRLQMVPSTGPYDFTVYLVTRDTAGRMCLQGGTNIVIGGVPYTSCRTPGRAIINLDRWRLSSKPYVAAKVPLATYRQYVINHEVGHELGHHHVGCPKQGGPAPVMVQQTLTLRGCVPNAWPRSGNSFLTGPSLN